MDHLPKHRVLGLMSGTSCDGLDMALVEFSGHLPHPQYRFIKAETRSYSSDWMQRLRAIMHASAANMAETEHAWTVCVADAVRDFLSDVDESPELIGFHGHTVFHQPQSGYTVQMGSGATLASLLGIDVVCNFRQQDVALGGQGAPLVPAGEAILFPETRAFLNLGGFANISIMQPGAAIRAFDICAVNVVLNRYVPDSTLAFDPEGRFAAKGTIQETLLFALNRVAYFNDRKKGSLGLEWVETEVLPLIEEWKLEHRARYANETQLHCDILASFCEHVAEQCAAVAPDAPILMSGGGVHHHYLVSRLQAQGRGTWIAAEPILLEFKEALIFALLAWLRKAELPNTLPSVTGAHRAVSSGAYYLGQ